jgi:hypothetical protein
MFETAGDRGRHGPRRLRPRRSSRRRAIVLIAGSERGTSTRSRCPDCCGRMRPELRAVLRLAPPRPRLPGAGGLISALRRERLRRAQELDRQRSVAPGPRGYGLSIPGCLGRRDRRRWSHARRAAEARPIRNSGQGHGFALAVDPPLRKRSTPGTRKAWVSRTGEPLESAPHRRALIETYAAAPIRGAEIFRIEWSDRTQREVRAGRLPHAPRLLDPVSRKPEMAFAGAEACSKRGTARWWSSEAR